MARHIFFSRLTLSSRPNWWLFGGWQNKFSCSSLCPHSTETSMTSSPLHYTGSRKLNLERNFRTQRSSSQQNKLIQKQSMETLMTTVCIFFDVLSISIPKSILQPPVTLPQLAADQQLTRSSLTRAAVRSGTITHIYICFLPVMPFLMSAPSHTKQGDKCDRFSRSTSRLRYLLWAKFKCPNTRVTFKGFQKSMSLSSTKVTVGTGVTLTGQGSTTPKALPLVSTNPNRAFGISSVLESLMSLALDACLLVLSLVCLQKITAVPLLFLPFPLHLQQSRAALHFCTLIHLWTLFNYKYAWFRDGKF